MSKWLVAAAFVVEVAGCGFGGESFPCTTDGQCQSASKPGGRCEPGVQLCSFPDPSCGPGGYRFGGLAGGQSGQCVGGGGGTIDAALDAPPDAQACFGTGILRICLQSAPTQPFMPTDPTTIDTGSSALCAALVSGGDYCVIAATTIDVQSSLQASGTKPLVLLASDTITTGPDAKIDVSSHRSPAELIGAGADSALCDPGTKPTNSGGGAGGSFAGSGGNGGVGAAAGASKGGVSGNPAAAITTLRGGCAGQAGDGGNNGAGGHGGGAIFFIAVTSISIGGDITAGGEGGAGAVSNTSGGGGGGTGGMIGFDAPTITVTSQLLANGGAGGEASTANGAGAPGADATTLDAAQGGSGNLLAGNGGDGSSGDAAGPGNGGRNGDVGVNGDRGGGGGGGGGAGLIKAPATASLGKNISPAASP